ncbi:iron transport regulator protein/ sensor kinase [Komagataeibacter nataicola NRIC 0616]|nr:iron transport regulator protein/ sensor kinase [Komagataeibacter nataicola NRIC 0616]
MWRRASIRSHAARWIARLHADDCTEADKQRFRQWLYSNPRHASAFEQLTELWELGGSPGPASARHAPARAMRPSRRQVLAGLAGAALLLPPMPRRAQAARVLQTPAGTFSGITLEGSVRCELDTDTRLVLLPDSQCGRLEKGQIVLSALGRAPPLWLFAGPVNLRLCVQGAANIRLDPDCVHVTAVRDRLLVKDPSLAGGRAWLPPGQRLSFFANGHSRQDTPDLNALLAWQQGRIVFRNCPLGEVVAEINRYMPQKITLQAPLLTGRRLSGVYYISRGDSFLQMLPHLLPVRLVRTPDGLEIAPV